jgi:hypothetical protein
VYNYSVLQNVRICSTFVHWILLQFKKHFKLVVFWDQERGRHAGRDRDFRSASE